MSRFAFALVAVVTVSLSLSMAACGGGKEYWHAQAVTSPDVTVTPTQIWVGGKKLWVRLNVQNGSKGTLIVNRDAIVAHTATGQTVGRASGAYTQHEPYVIMPGSFHPVYVEFEEQGFNWREAGGVQIDLGKAIMKDGQPVVAPPLAANP